MTYTLVGGGGQRRPATNQPGGTEPAPAIYADQPMAVWEAPVGVPDMLSAETAWVTPVELLAALNAEGGSFTLVLMPDAGRALCLFRPEPVHPDPACS